MEKLRVGFIGVGGISRLHYLGYKDNPNAEVYSICDADEKQLGERQRDWGIQRAHTDYRELLDDPNVDAVEVMVPHHLHALVGIAALQAGPRHCLTRPLMSARTDPCGGCQATGIPTATRFSLVAELQCATGMAGYRPLANLPLMGHKTGRL